MKFQSEYKILKKINIYKKVYVKKIKKEKFNKKFNK